MEEIYWRIQLNKFLAKGKSPYDYEKRYLVDNFECVRDYLRGFNTYPLRIEIHPASVCNVSCEWCVGGHRNIEKADYLSKEEMIRVIRQLNVMNLRDELRFAGFNGEPLMNPETLSAMEEALKLNFKIGLTTNGILLNKEARNLVVNFKYVNISIDAGNAETYSNLKGTSEQTFYTVLENIRALVSLKKILDSKLRITVSYIIHPNNFWQITEFAEKLHLIGVNAFQIKSELGFENFKFDLSLIQGMFGALKKLKAIYRKGSLEILTMQNEKEFIEKNVENSENWKPPKIRLNKCYLGMVMPAIGADGCLYPCCHLGYKTLGKMGHISEASFEEVWNRGKTRLRGKKPLNWCLVCPIADYRINQLMNFLDIEFKKDSDFLYWLQYEMKRRMKEK